MNVKFEDICQKFYTLMQSRGSKYFGVGVENPGIPDIRGRGPRTNTTHTNSPIIIIHISIV